MNSSKTVAPVLVVDKPTMSPCSDPSILYQKQKRARKENVKKDVKANRSRFPCSVCAKTFSRRAHAKRHFQNLHSVSLTAPTGSPLPSMVNKTPILITFPSGETLPISSDTQIFITKPEGVPLVTMPSNISFPITKPEGVSLPMI